MFFFNLARKCKAHWKVPWPCVVILFECVSWLSGMPSLPFWTTPMFVWLFHFKHLPDQSWKTADKGWLAADQGWHANDNPQHVADIFWHSVDFSDSRWHASDQGLHDADAPQHATDRPLVSTDQNRISHVVWELGWNYRSVDNSIAEWLETTLWAWKLPTRFGK